MELFEAIAKRYSCRDLKAVEIPRGDLEKILDAGRRAASGNNVQPFEFLVLTAAKDIEKIASAQGFIAKASAIIVIVADPDKSPYWLEDISAAAQNMLLAISALSYGCTWVEGTTLRKEPEFKEYLGIPEHLRLMIFLPIGQPALAGEQKPKKSLSTMIHWQKW